MGDKKKREKSHLQHLSESLGLMWTLEIGAGWVLGVTHQGLLAHDSAAAEDFEMENFNTSVAGLGLFSNSFPCFAPCFRASQASRSVCSTSREQAQRLTTTMARSSPACEHQGFPAPDLRVLFLCPDQM